MQLSVLLTGGTGTFGQAMALRLLGMPQVQRIIIYSRSEHKQAEMAEKFAPLDEYGRLRFFIGCVRDRDRLRRAMQGVSTVYHAAALKRIEVGHYNPVEMVKTNVGGAVNVIEAAQDAQVMRVVALSTDKAWQPVSPYGCSKAMAEALFLAANNATGHLGPVFGVCRYGNVWGSNGSVVPKWKAILEHSDTVPVTDPDCTRFFMRIDEAVDLVLNTSGGELSIPDLPAYRLGDLAEAMGAKMNIIGLPEWEKKHEGMGPGNTSDVARRMTVDELRNALTEVQPIRII